MQSIRIGLTINLTLQIMCSVPAERAGTFQKVSTTSHSDRLGNKILLAFTLQEAHTSLSNPAIALGRNFRVPTPPCLENNSPVSNHRIITLRTLDKNFGNIFSRSGRIDGAQAHIKPTVTSTTNQISKSPIL
jgi:hypothetical protein